jgi:transcriptional regulator with XRE-family HTH domain
MKTRIRPYPVPSNTTEGDNVAKRKYHIPNTQEPFGKRLTQLRKASGLTQVELAQHVGISQRMIVYYERETSHPPTHLLAAFAKALGVSTDQLLGVEKVKEIKRRDTRLRKRVEEIEKLPPHIRKHVTQYLDHVLNSWRTQHGKA